MIPILNFILGFLLGSVGISLLQCFTDCVYTVTELIKSKLTVKIAEYNLKVEQSLQETKPVERAIGFSMVDEGEQEYDDEEIF